MCIRDSSRTTSSIERKDAKERRENR
jgi:hypothetical protein